MKNYTDSETLIKDINKKRKENKDKWFYFVATFKGEALKMKVFNTWVQRLEYSGYIDGSVMDLPVKGFNAFLNRHFKES